MSQPFFHFAEHKINYLEKLNKESKQTKKDNKSTESKSDSTFVNKLKYFIY